MNCSVSKRTQERILKLEKSVEACIHPRKPFHFDATMHKPSHFPSSDNYYEKGRFWFTTYFLSRQLGIRILDFGSIDEPAVKASIYSEEPLEDEEMQATLNEVKWRFDMDADLSDFYNRFEKDALLQPIFERWRGMRVKACQSLYEFLVIAVVLQNAPVRRSVQMMENLFNAYGYKVQFDGKALSCFWPPQLLAKAGEDALRALKVGYRAKALSRISKEFADGKVNEMKMRFYSKEQLRKELLMLYGIGPASVWYIMFEIFHHYDALETISPWEQKIYSRLLFNRELVPKDIIVEEVTRRWGNYRMLAMHYILEDLFWKRKEGRIEWLEELIRL